MDTDKRPRIQESRVSIEEDSSVELTGVMPCLNVAETLGIYIEKAQRAFSANNIAGEVVVAGNGSMDVSQKIATLMGARVVNVSARGYGNALMGGIATARGRKSGMEPRVTWNRINGTDRMPCDFFPLTMHPLPRRS